MKIEELFSVAGKVAVVTGGSRGIGEMITRGYLENGAKVYISARKEAELTATAERLSEFGECVPLVADLSSQAGVEAFAADIAVRESRVDVLVNNAGASWGAPFSEFPESGWDKVMDLNLKSLFFLTQKLETQLVAAGSAQNPARVINIASVNGITHPRMDTYSYSTSKAGVIHLTRHLAADLADRHITVNAIAPGFFPSKMTAFLMEEEEKLVADIPLGRMGAPGDAAGAAIYLASPAGAWVTGETLIVDGGFVARAG